MELLDISWEQLEQGTQRLVNELRLAQAGHQTNFSYFQHNLSVHAQLDEKEQIQVLTIGGSSLKSVMVDPQTGLIDTSTFKQAALPLLETKSVFLEMINEYLDTTTTLLVVNFAYPLEPIERNGHIDGKLLRGTKEHSFTDLVGRAVGEAIEQSADHSLKVVCANDSVCLTLAALMKNPSLDRLSLLSMILGTGNNFSMFIEPSVVVNLESGNFTGFGQTPSGKWIDQQTDSPGSQWLEKEVSGAYLYHHFNYYAEHARLEVALTDSRQLNSLAQQSNATGELARQVLCRSAALVGAMLKGFWLYKQHPVTCVVEGSLFWQGYQYEVSVKEALDHLSVPNNAVKLVQIDDSALLGGLQLAYLS